MANVGYRFHLSNSFCFAALPSGVVIDKLKTNENLKSLKKTLATKIINKKILLKILFVFKMTVPQKKLSHKRLVRLFVRNLKKNTLALKDLKATIDKKNDEEKIDKIIDITNSVNDKLDVVNKLRNDIKIYKTINTILTNHYVKETRDHENSIDGKIIKLETEIKNSYEELKRVMIKMSEAVSDKEKQGIQNSNVILVGNDLKCNNYNQFYIRNEIYNNIIRKIDKLFCGMVSDVLGIF